MHLKLYLIIFLGSILLLSCKQNKSMDLEESTLENDATVEVVLELQIPAKLGEGAFWDHATQSLYWVDILSKKFYRFRPETKANVGYDLPSLVGTIVPQSDTTVVVALEDGIYIKSMVNDSLVRLSDIESNILENRFNDGKADPNGNLWVGSMNLKETDPTGALYKVTPQGDATQILNNITISNGIVWSKDGLTMYYIDTPTAVIRAFDFDKNSASVSNERVVVKVPEHLGYPDGMTIDSEDKLWVGMWNGNAVVRFDPESGEVLERIEVPARNVTSCAFGGPNFDILYITTASVKMTEEEKKQFPMAGSLFSVKPGVQGVPSPRFGSSE